MLWELTYVYYVKWRLVDIAFADIDTILIFVTQNICDIDILYCSALWLTDVFHCRPQNSR